jgi:hypothetical protein
MAIITTLLLMTATLANNAPAAAPFIETLTVQANGTHPPDIRQDTLCSVGLDVCFEVSKQKDSESTTLKVTRNKTVLTYPLSESEISGGYDRSWFKPWPKIIRAKSNLSAQQDDIVIFGVIEGLSTMYSGGGAQFEILTLYRLTQKPLGSSDKAEANLEPVLSVPFLGRVMIRACFSEKDYKIRRGVCHDNYDFNTELSVKNAAVFGYPDLSIKSEATTQPGSSRRSNDNTSGRKRLKKSELKEAVDSDCSYERTARFDEKTGAYAFDKPLPDCSDYTVP